MSADSAPTIRPAAVCPACGNLLVPTERGMECFTHGLPTTESKVDKALRLRAASDEAWVQYVTQYGTMTDVELREFNERRKGVCLR